MEGGTYDTTIDPGTPTESVTYQWPLADGTNGQTIITNGSGVLSFTDITATPAGADTNVQYNNSGSLGAEAAFAYNATNNTLSITQAASNPTFQSGDGSYSWSHTPQVGIEGAFEVDGTAHFDSTVDINEEIDIDFDANDEEVSIVNSAEYGADGAQVTIQNTDADVGAAMYLLRLRYTDDGQANADFAVFEDNIGDDMIAFTDGGGITAQGTIEGATLTEGGNAVYNSSETPGGELGGTWASPTIDDSVAVSSWNLTTPTITGEAIVADPGGVLLSDDNYIELDATADGMDDDEYNGVVIGGRNCGETLAQWDLVEIVNDADPWHKADATAASGEYPAFGISVAACTDTNEARILVKGVVRNEGWTGLTPGAPIYLGETDGALTETAPSTSNDCVQIVGYALSDSEIYFDFSRPWQLVE
jgi:hypothetical protein